MSHLDNHHVLSDAQHGFRKNRSCETQLIVAINDFAKSLNNGEQMDSILMDFSKAFDVVCHRKLVLKLGHYGIQGKTLKWVENFLKNRTQRVVVEGKSSDIAKVTSGVPQGTVLGPLLFLVYINDLPLTVSSNIGLFADDTYIYRTIRDKNDCIDLQNDINSLIDWESKWSMKFHPDKCKLLRITNKRNIIDFKYNIHDCPLKIVDHSKYLGVEIDKKLKWKHHVSIITAKANQYRQMLQRNLVSVDSSVKLNCYKSLIRPIVEFASPVWDPVGNKDLQQKLELVLKKAARWVFNNWSYRQSASAMVRKLSLPTLAERREIARLKFLHNIYHGKKFIPYQLIPVKARSENLRFKQIHGRVQTYCNSFIPFTVKQWNDLPSRIVNIDDVNKFDNELCKLI